MEFRKILHRFKSFRYGDLMQFSAFVQSFDLIEEMEQQRLNIKQFLNSKRQRKTHLYAVNVLFVLVYPLKSDENRR